MDSRFPDYVENAVRRSGWSPTRRVPYDSRTLPVALFAAAQSVLEEFGGLRVEALPPAQLAPDASLASIGVWIDPAARLKEFGNQERFLEEINDIQAATGLTLFPLGRSDDGWILLYADNRGCVFGMFIPTGEFKLIAPTFDEALTILLTGAARGGSAQPEEWQL